MRVLLKSGWRDLSLVLVVVLLAVAMLFLLTSSGRQEVSRFPDVTITLRQPGVPVRILPLGDSITQGDVYHRSFRYELWKRLIDAGIEFDFVGTLDSNRVDNPVWPDYRGRKFDRHHEGRWGWRADEILYGLPDEGNDNLSEWIKDYTYDIAMVHLGTNDIFDLQNTTSTMSDLIKIIDVLRTRNANVTVLLAKIIPVKDQELDALIRDLNSRMKIIAKEASTPASPVIVVDHYRGFDVEEDTYDWIHPNELGEQKMAFRWFEALRHLLNNGKINYAPRASIRAKPTSGSTPLRVYFDADGSTDPDNDRLKYHWNFGDGTSGTGIRISHTYKRTGTFTAKLTVQDICSGIDVAMTTINTAVFSQAGAGEPQGNERR